MKEIKSPIVPDAIYERLNSVFFVQYHDPEKIVGIFDDAFYADMAEQEGVTVEELKEQVVESNVSLEDHIKSVKEQGYWGFYDSHLNIIHLYLDHRVSMVVVIHLIAHEMAHVVEDFLADIEDSEELPRNEVLAEVNATIAVMAFKQAVKAWDCVKDRLLKDIPSLPERDTESKVD